MKKSCWGEGFGMHHPYCKKTYIEFVDSEKKSWNCICDLLKDYDKWRISKKRERKS